MEAEIRAILPNIDPVVSDYSAGYLAHASTTWVEEDKEAGGGADGASPMAEAAAAITDLLLSASGVGSRSAGGGTSRSGHDAKLEAQIRSLVDRWVERYAASASEEAGGRRRRGNGPAVRRLDQTIQVGAQRNMSSTLAVATVGVDVESANSRKVESRVDRKKLEKAERKIAAKQSKKTFKTVEYEASRLIGQPETTQSYEEFYMAVNPLQLGAGGSQGKSKDIKLDNIDVSIGGLRILTDTSLTLSYGHRYGLVGHNGVGKSTLLRALSRRELPIPTHISILHVEQEVFHGPDFFIFFIISLIELRD